MISLVLYLRSLPQHFIFFFIYLFVNSQVRLFVCLLSLLLVGFLNRLCQSLHHLGQITIMTPILGHYGSIGYTCGYLGNGRGRGNSAALQRIHLPWRRWENAGCVCLSVCLSVDRLKYCAHMSKIYLSRSKGLAKPIITGWGVISYGLPLLHFKMMRSN